MAYESSTEGGADIGASVFHFDASQPDRVNISDAELLFRGHFARSGPDLVLTGDDGERHLVPGYFASENHPTLYAPNGAHLSGDVVDMLAGSPTPGHYAQAQQTLPPDAIGKVQKVVGSVTVIRNGTAVGLHVGDAIHKSDVIETGVNSSCGIAFPDGTALDLVANTRMALNDYTYDVAGSANNALFTLVEGTFAFVAGQVAHTGNGMKISTPVATMGIRGTVGLFKTDRTVVGSNLGQVWSVFLHEDLDGSHHLGRIAFIDQDPNSPTYGQVFYLLDSSDYIAYLEPRSGASPLVRLEPINNSKLFDDRHYFDDLTQILNSFNNANPQSPSGTQGSGDNPDFLKINQQLLGPGGGGPSYNYNPRNGDLPPILTPTFGGVPVQDGKLNSNTSLIFVWNGTGTWPSTSPWNQGSAPNSPIDQVIIQSGTATFPGGQTSLAQLTVDPGATLDITGGLFTVGQLVDNGTIIVDGDPPTVVISGPATIGPGHVMDAVGSGTEIDFIGSTLDNQGVVAALQHGVIAINGESVTNESGGVLAAIGGSLQINNSVVTNAGILGAGPDGTVTIDHSTIANTGGVIAAVSFPGHSGGIVNLSDSTIVGGTLITSGLAGDDGSAIDVVAASGANMSVLDGSTSAVTVGGYVDVLSGAQLELKGTIHLDGAFGEIAVGGGAQAANLIIDGNVTLDTDGESELAESIVLQGGHILGTASGRLENTNAVIAGYGEIDGNLQLINDTSGFIVADDGKLTIDTGHTVTNDGQMQAENHGTLDVLDDVVGSGGVTISGGSTADFAGSFNEAVTFGATSTSALNTFELAETNYGGTVHDFAVGDGIELANLTFASSVSAVWDQAAGELEIFNGTQEIEEIKLSGSFAANAFTVITAPDGSGNTEVVLKEGVEEEWINTAGGSWSVAGNWSEGVPTSASDAFVDLDGNYTITIAPSDHATAQSLTISDAGATLNGSGTLTLDALENHGTIEVTSFAEFTINELGDDIENFGTIQAIDGASLIVNHSGPSVNEITGIIKADGCGSSVTLNNNLDNANYGKVLAANRGTVTINLADTGAGIGGNFGCMEALNAGAMIIIGDMFNAADATIAAHGPYSTVTFEAADYAADAPTILDNEGNILATDYGTVQIADVGIDNNGTIGAKCHGTVEIAFSLIDNQGGTIAAGGHGSAVDLYHVGIAGGTLQTGDLTDSKHGVIDIVAPGGEAGNTVDFDGSLHGALIVDAFVRVEAGADLALSGTINNNGTIDLVDPEISGGHLVIDGTVHLNGSGTVTLDGGNAEIVGANGNEANALCNDNTIAGAGLIGGNDLKLINEAFGLIDANVADQTLTIDTDHTFENDGTLKADGGTLLVDDNVTGVGSVVITDGGTADFAGIFNESAAFQGAGTLVLQHSLSDNDYSGMISGFRLGDAIDLADLTYSKCLTDYWNSSTDTLSIYDNHRLEETLQFTGSYCQGNFALVQDNGTGTEVVFTPNVSDDSWLHASNGSWTTDNDWSGGVPTSDLNAAIDVNGSYTVTTCGEVTAKSLTIGDVHATLKGSGTLSIPTIVNDGTIDTDGLLTITGNVTGTGGLHIENGARLVLDGTCTDTVTYEGGHGTLEIASDGSGTPFSVTGGALQQNDVIYLPHINFDATADSYDANTDVLTVGDGHGHTVTIDIVGGLAPGHSFSFESDNGGTLVQDPADSISAGGVVTLADTQAASAETVGFTAGNNGSQYIGAFSLGAVTNGNAGASVDWQFSLDDDQINLAPGQTVTQSYDVTAAAGQNGAASQTVSISIGGPGNDNFVFGPGVGADTIVNFNPQADTIELDHFANVQNQQQLAEAITTDASGDVVIELGHGDSITIPGVSTSYMQQHLQSLVHLH